MIHNTLIHFWWNAPLLLSETFSFFHFCWLIRKQLFSTNFKELNNQKFLHTKVVKRTLNFKVNLLLKLIKFQGPSWIPAFSLRSWPSRSFSRTKEFQSLQTKSEDLWEFTKESVCYLCFSSLSAYLSQSFDSLFFCLVFKDTMGVHKRVSLLSL